VWHLIANKRNSLRSKIYIVLHPYNLEVSVIYYLQSFLTKFFQLDSSTLGYKNIGKYFHETTEKQCSFDGLGEINTQA
jgi:hypothetical protein